MSICRKVCDDGMMDTYHDHALVHPASPCLNVPFIRLKRPVLLSAAVCSWLI